ncbi:MAG: hypothetical protein LC130_24760 [Bryobacterales bacterium]|nr:hypothetical protein [Bryobacterales bacterium]
MPTIYAIDRPLLWTVTQSNAILASGLTEIGGLTITGEDKALVSDADENAFLGAVAGRGGDYNPLPDAGEWVEAGAIYGYAGGLVIVRQSHTRTEHAPEDVPALFIVWREDADEVLEWVAREQVHLGTRRVYDGVLYECLQPHVTESTWTPPATPNLWRVVESEPETPPAWQQPTGAHDAYNIGDRVTFEGSIYESLIDANVWSPTAYPQGWQLIGPA